MRLIVSFTYLRLLVQVSFPRFADDLHILYYCPGYRHDLVCNPGSGLSCRVLSVCDRSVVQQIWRSLANDVLSVTLVILALVTVRGNDSSIDAVRDFLIML